VEFLDAFKQIECERSTGKVDAKVALQMKCYASAPQAA